MRRARFFAGDVREIIKCEAEALLRLADTLESGIVQALEAIDDCNKIVITGIGKSAHIGRKMAATFTSVGKPAVFMHATEAVHGDLGIIQHNDCIIAISNSGETTEVVDLVRYCNQFIAEPVIVITGNRDSSLAREADVIIETSHGREADINDLVPTCSTTNTLAIGDALAIAWMETRGIGPEDFKMTHPGGSLGKQLEHLSD